MEKIVCQGDKWGTHSFGNTVPKNINTNLTALKNLKKFSLDLKALVPNDFERSFLLHLKYIYGDEESYSIEKEKNEDKKYALLLKQSKIMKLIMKLLLFDPFVWK